MPLLFNNTAIEGKAYIVGNYRYWLERRWAEGPACLFVMVNPSDADAKKNDPTITRCIGFARAFGFCALWVCNLYAWIDSNPDALWQTADPVGAGNDAHIEYYAKQAGWIVAAWGVNGQPERIKRVLNLMAHQPLYCLGKTKDGYPRHPLYLKASTQPVPYEWEER